ncbi:MAG: hypothetical protein QG597_4664 [Actinomycetota bacterium]|nr:hypothetical protein [Actinomycetota bacterium]
MTGLEVAVGCVAAWAWHKARRVAGRADAVVDEALDTAVDRVREAVVSRLGPEPALGQLETEAGADLDRLETRDLTRQRVLLALQDAVENDPQFAARLEVLLAQVRAAQHGSGVQAVSASGQRSVAVGGDNAGIIATGDGATNTQQR